MDDMINLEINFGMIDCLDLEDHPPLFSTSHTHCLISKGSAPGFQERKRRVRVTGSTGAASNKLHVSLSPPPFSTSPTHCLISRGSTPGFRERKRRVRVTGSKILEPLQINYMCHFHPPFSAQVPPIVWYIKRASKQDGLSLFPKLN